MGTVMDLGFPYAEKLLEFYNFSGRTFPWRNTRDPYPLWISEVMLQQTGVAVVPDYYDRFLKKFPGVDDLARADIQEVLMAWQGLGYYRRAQNLHRAAKMVQNDLGGNFPETLEGWMSLPGVGRTTAAAIMAIGWNQRQAILDGNVKRVLARVTALDESVNGVQGERFLWKLAFDLTPEERPGDYAQAIMDLGATVCTPRAPRCPECPWCLGCRALAELRVDSYPVKKKLRSRSRCSQVAIVVQREAGQFLMCRRPEGGWLAGMWEPLSLQPVTPPELPPDVKKVGDDLQRQWQVIGRDVTMLGEVQHVFTHFHLTVSVFSCRYVSGWPTGIDGVRWVILGQSDVPVSTLHAKVLSLVAAP